MTSGFCARALGQSTPFAILPPTTENISLFEVYHIGQCHGVTGNLKIFFCFKFGSSNYFCHLDLSHWYLHPVGAAQINLICTTTINENQSIVRTSLRKSAQANLGSIPISQEVSYNDPFLRAKKIFDRFCGGISDFRLVDDSNICWHAFCPLFNPYCCGHNRHQSSVFFGLFQNPPQPLSKSNQSCFSKRSFSNYSHSHSS